MSNEVEVGSGLNVKLANVETLIRVGTAAITAVCAVLGALKRWRSEGRKWTISSMEGSPIRTAVLKFAECHGCKYKEYTVYNDGIKFPVGPTFVALKHYRGIWVRGSITVGKSGDHNFLLQVRAKSAQKIAEFVERVMAHSKAANEALDRADCRMYVNKDDEFKRVDMGPSSFETLFLPCCDAVIREVGAFVNGRANYERVGTKWQKMIMFYGDPGCGKTSLIMAIARYFKRNPVFMPLHQFKTLAELIARIQESGDEIAYSKSMIVLEEADTWAPICQKRRDASDVDSSDGNAFSSSSCVDAAFLREKEQEGRDNQLGNLLNMFDGVRAYPGLFVVMTTNHIQEFDPALIRPGRATCIEVGKMQFEHINRTFRLYFGEDLPDEYRDMSTTLANLAWLRDYIGDRDGALAEFRRRFHTA